MSSQDITVVDQFKEMLHSDAVQSGFGAVLPKDVDQEMFTAVVVRAIQEDPGILDADRKSLLLACQDAAKDGLVPDKREGALVTYNQKVNNQWVKKIQWQPMIGGLRKNLARAGFDIRAEVVYENDEFDQELGDNPAITHKPPQLGEPRGNVIGAYAIATRLTTGEKYREVMSYAQLEEVREIAKSKNIWDKWTVEMYRKTVARKLVKFLPITGEESDLLYGMLERDNSNFQHADPGASETAKTVQAEVRKPAKKTASKKPALPKVKAAPKAVTDTPPPPPPVEPEPQADEPDNAPPVDDPDDPGF